MTSVASTGDPRSVLRERYGHVEVVTLNRPEKRNALDTATIDALGHALSEAEADAGVRAIVLTGAGDRAFCARMDPSRVGSVAGVMRGAEAAEGARAFLEKRAPNWD